MSASSMAEAGPAVEVKNEAVMIAYGAERELLLTSRGFHWINESPFNR